MDKVEISEEYLNLIIEQQKYDILTFVKINNYLRKIDNRNYILSNEELKKRERLSEILYFMYLNNIIFLKAGSENFHLTNDFLRYMKGE